MWCGVAFARATGLIPAADQLLRELTLGLGMRLPDEGILPEQIHHRFARG